MTAKAELTLREALGRVTASDVREHMTKLECAPSDSAIEAFFGRVPTALQLAGFSQECRRRGSPWTAAALAGAVQMLCFLDRMAGADEAPLPRPIPDDPPAPESPADVRGRFEE